MNTFKSFVAKKFFFQRNSLFIICCLFFEMYVGLAQKPNFVFIYRDDQRYDALSVVQREQGDKVRFPWLKTHNLDKLAEEGIQFRNAFVVQSLCTPSRASFLTGQYTHTHNIYTNFTNLPENTDHWGKLLTDAGNQTVYIGKWHMGDQRGQRPGFTYFASYVGQGKYFDTTFEVNGKPEKNIGWVDDLATDYALEFIKKNKDNHLAMAIGFKTLHVPFTTPEAPFDKLYPDAAMGPVQNHVDFPIYLGRVETAKPEHLKRFGNTLTKDYIDYYRTLTAIDANVGRIMELHSELDLDQNTVVICSSDNRYHFGEHGIGDKRSAYEVPVRIPMLLRYPASGMKNNVIDAIVLNIDLVPTLLNLAGLPIPEKNRTKFKFPDNYENVSDDNLEPWRNGK